MSNKKGTSREKNSSSIDEVEELLLAAQDDLLLNLNLNSHLSHSSSSSSSPLDQDLSRRFEALKSSKITKVAPSRPQEKTTTAAPNSTSDSTTITKLPLPENNKEEELDRVLGADLSSRFAALKGYSSSKTCTTESQPSLVRSDGGDSDDEEDEVDKVIQWAIDAACLDPSSPTDEDDDDDDEDDKDEDEEHEEERQQTKRKQQQKK